MEAKTKFLWTPKRPNLKAITGIPRDLAAEADAWFRANGDDIIEEVVRRLSRGYFADTQGRVHRMPYQTEKYAEFKRHEHSGMGRWLYDTGQLLDSPKGRIKAVADGVEMTVAFSGTRRSRTNLKLMRRLEKTKTISGYPSFDRVLVRSHPQRRGNSTIQIQSHWKRRSSKRADELRRRLFYWKSRVENFKEGRALTNARLAIYLSGWIGRGRWVRGRRIMPLLTLSEAEDRKWRDDFRESMAEFLQNRKIA